MSNNVTEMTCHGRLNLKWYIWHHLPRGALSVVCTQNPTQNRHVEACIIEILKSMTAASRHFEFDQVTFQSISLPETTHFDLYEWSSYMERFVEYQQIFQNKLSFSNERCW